MTKQICFEINIEIWNIQNLTGWTNGGTPNVSLYKKPSMDIDQTSPSIVAISIMC